MPEPEFLLTKEEAGQATDALPDKATWGDYRNAIAQAALKKVAAWLDEKAAHHNGLPRFNREEWEAFKREAGLAEKGEPDANA